MDRGHPKLRRLTLAFAAPHAGVEAEALEEGYLADSFEHSLPIVRIGGITTAVLVASWGPGDCLTVPQYCAPFEAVRYGVIVAPIVLLLLATWLPSFRRYWQPAIAAAFSLGAMGMGAFCLTVAGTPPEALYFATLNIMLVLGCSLTRLRFVWAAPAALLPVSSFVVAQAVLGRATLGTQVNDAALLLTGTTIGVVMAYLVERFQRHAFADRLRLLALERERRVRIEEELTLAKSIQEMFIPREALPEASGLALAALYLPATEVAGDWYNYFHDPSSGETIVAIADVSGHGAGSAMFTAIIAGMFEEVKSGPGFGGRPLTWFAEAVNRRVLTLGRSHWHATLQLLRYSARSAVVEMCNAGHPFPITLAPGRGAMLVAAPSDVLGLCETPTLALTTFEQPRGASIFLYSDGFLEASTMARAVRHLGKLAKAWDHREESEPPALLAEITRHLGGAQEERRPVDDDVCAMVVRRVA